MEHFEETALDTRFRFWKRYVWQEGSHVIHWNRVKLLDFSQGMVERKVKEAIYINMSPNNLTMNRDWEWSFPL